MKICFLSSMHPPTDKRVFEKEARSLVEKGFDVVHLAPGDTKSCVKEGVFLEVYPAPSGTKSRLLGLPSLFKRAKRINADVYHCNEIDSWIVGIFLKIFLKRKVVFDVHENYPEQIADSYFSETLRPFVRFWLRVFFRFLIPFTDYFVFAKESAMRDFPGTEKKSCVVNNYSFLRYKDKMRSNIDGSIRKKYEEGITAVHLGLFSKIRGWPQLLEAMSLMRHKELKVVFIGTLNDGSEEEFKRNIRMKNLENRMRGISWLPFEEAYDHLLCCQIGLICFQPVIGNEYAYPHKMFDYMLAGLPIIVPDFAVVLCNIVKEVNCGLVVDTTSPSAMAKALDSLIDDPSLAHRLGQNGRKAVIERYNWESEVQKLFKLYDSLMKKCVV